MTYNNLRFSVRERCLLGKFRNVLLVRLSAIGDIVNCLPALRLLKRAYPGVRVTWAAEQPSASLLKGDPDIEEVFLVRRREWTRGILNAGNMASFGAAFGYLRRKRFDLAIDFQGNLRSGVVTFGSGARVRIGFTAGRVKEHSHLFYTRHAVSPRAAIHRIERNLLLLRAIGIEPRVLPARLTVGPEDARGSIIFLKEKNLDDRQFTTLHPGVSKFGAFKQWNADGFAEVARRLVQQRKMKVVVTWGPGERALAEKIVKMSGEGVMLGPEPAGLRELAYLLGKSALFVGCDTGPLHIAAAAGTPAVAIFGPKDPSIYAPAGNGHRVVRRELPCSPCERRTCADPKCMQLITPDEVYGACLSILERL